VGIEVCLNPREPFSSHRRRGSMYRRKRRGLSESPCMLPLRTGKSSVGPCGSEMWSCMGLPSGSFPGYMLRMTRRACSGIPKWCNVCCSLSWSAEPNAFVKSIYMR